MKGEGRVSQAEEKICRKTTEKDFPNRLNDSELTKRYRLDHAVKIFVVDVITGTRTSPTRHYNARNESETVLRSS